MWRAQVVAICINSVSYSDAVYLYASCLNLISCSSNCRISGMNVRGYCCFGSYTNKDIGQRAILQPRVILLLVWVAVFHDSN